MSLENIIMFIILILINTFFYFINYKLAEIFKLVDIPDKVRKIHTFNVPLTGGIFLFLNILIIFCLENYFTLTNNLILDMNLFLFIIIIFIFGIIDDKFGIKANLKLSLSIALFFFFLYLNDNFVLKTIIISSGHKYDLGIFSLPFTVFCLVIFQNAFNMYDGINLQNILFFIFLIFIIYIFFGFIDFYIYLIPSLILLLYLNSKNKMFLGDSGSYILSFLISIFLIYIFNNTTINIPSDFVFLCLCIPGYDLLRLAIHRIFNKKHPFKADKNHIHHMMIKKIGYLKTIIYLNFLCFIPILFSLFSNKNFYAVFISLIVYIITIAYFKNDKISEN
tara:strand:- start:358 stop:1362 length:1005 start_codon:yes stop_codon:yes gene_type:complete